MKSGHIKGNPDMGFIWDHYIHQDMSEADLDSETELNTRERQRLSSVMKCIMGGNLKTRWTTSKMGKDSSDGSVLILLQDLWQDIWQGYLGIWLIPRLPMTGFGSCSDL